MDNNDHFDTHLVYKLDNRVVENPYIIEKKIIEYFNKFFYLLKNSSGAYVEIYKNKYYIRKYELMCKELGRFNIMLVKEKDNTHYPFPFFRSLILENNYLQTIEKKVLEPQLDKFTRIYVENEPVFNLWKGF